MQQSLHVSLLFLFLLFLLSLCLKLAPQLAGNDCICSPILFKTGKQDCAVFAYPHHVAGKWDDQTCTNSRTFVCEIPRKTTGTSSKCESFKDACYNLIF